MKSPSLYVWLLFSLLAVSSAGAADDALTYARLELTDGRKLTQVVVKSYDPTTDKVLLLADNKAIKVALTLLPASLRERVKDAAPKAGASTSSTPSTRPGALRAPASASERPVPSPSQLDPAEHKQAALERAQNFYRYEFQAGSGSVHVTAMNFETDDPEPVPGWTGRYSVRGRVLLEFFDSRGNSFNRSTDRFEILTEQKPGASIKVIDFSRR